MEYCLELETLFHLKILSIKCCLPLEVLQFMTPSPQDLSQTTLLLQAQHSAEKWKNIYALFKRNEINFENFIQVLVLILLVALRFTKTATVGGLQDLFSSDSENTALIVLSAIWSCKSLITGQLAYWVSGKNGFVLAKGKILVAL